MQAQLDKAAATAKAMPAWAWYALVAVGLILFMLYGLQLSWLNIILTAITGAMAYLVWHSILESKKNPDGATAAEEMIRLSNILLVAGAVMTLIELVAAGFLYQSFGFTPFERALYFAYGIVLGLLGSLFLPLAATLWRVGYILTAALIFAIWLCVLFPIATQTHLGVMAKSQADLAAGGLQAQAIKLKMDAAAAEAGQYESAAAVDVAAVNSRLKELQAQQAAADAKLIACPANYKKNCIIPAREELAQIQAEIGKQEALLSGVKQRNQALGLQVQAAEQLAEVSSGGAVTDAHPLFITQSKMIGYSPSTTQAFFIGGSALAFTVLTALVLMISGLLKSRAKLLLGGGVVYGYGAVAPPQTTPAGIGPAGIGFIQQPATAQFTAPVHDSPGLDIGDRPGTAIGQGISPGFVPMGFRVPSSEEAVRIRTGQAKPDDSIQTGTDSGQAAVSHSTATGNANLDCIRVAILMGYSSGALSPTAGRVVTGKYLREKKYTVSTDNLIAAMQLAKTTWEEFNANG